MLFARSGKALRKKLVVHLGKWHPFKELAALVWRFYLPIHLADSFFALFPTSSCKTKPKLTSILTMFTYHFQSYPHIRDTLQEALQATTNHRDQHENLLNLRDFYEVYIPTVRNVSSVFFFLHFFSCRLETLYLLFALEFRIGCLICFGE